MKKIENKEYIPAFLNMAIVLTLFYTAWAQDTTKAKETGQTPSFEALDRWMDAIDRKVAIHPKHPSIGINTGLVIIYGHLLQPPFALAYHDRKLYVNDVQVKPSIIVEREASKKAIPQEAKEKAKLLGKIANELEGMARQGAPRDEIMRSAKAHEGITSVRWSSANAIDLHFDFHGHDNSFSVELPQKNENKVSNLEIQKRTEAARKAELLRIEGWLKHGSLVNFSSSGMISRRPIDKIFFLNINQIMLDSHAAPKDKVDHLMRDVFGKDRVKALDILANYSKTEWVIK